MTDMLGSLGAIVSGGLIWAFGWNWADPAASFFIGLLVIYSSWGLLRETVSVLMESAPSHIDVDQVRQAMLSVDGVEGVQDLHVWTITSGMESLSAHAAIKKGMDPGALLKELRSLLKNRFHIDHTTIQIEVGGFTERATHR
jgi:cobalt-zinc-cadmium efflux system protein